MKSTINFLVLIFGLLLANVANAESPREQLQQMVGQLQKTPNDNALREKIIKLTPTLKPAPTLPDTAVTFEGRAQFAFRNAKSEDDFLAAAREYEKAVAAAPWVPGYYADLCTIYEKAGKFEDAKRHCGFYLMGLTDPAQKTDVKRRIAGLEFGIEKVATDKRRATEEANSPKTRAEALVAILRKQYSGSVTKTLICGVKLNQYWNCTENEARGSNWFNSFDIEGGNGQSFYPAKYNPVRFKVVDAAGTILFTAGDREYCGKPNRDDPNMMGWRLPCSGTNSGKYAASVIFTTSTTGSGVISISYSCDKNGSCRREQLIFN